jgi:hypothetical protein
VLIHDSQFAFGERRDFPAVGRLPDGRISNSRPGRIFS